MSSDVAHTLAGLRSESQRAEPIRGPRLWPAVVLVGLFWAWFLVARALELATFVRFLSSIAACALLLLAFSVWWLRNRRVSGTERLIGFGTAVAAGAAAVLLSLQTLGAIGLLLMALPYVITAWTLWLVLARKASAPTRRAGLAAALVLAWGAFTLIRMDGLSGEQVPVYRWRWSPTAEDLYLADQARPGEAPTDPATPVPTLGPGDWPGFRGPNRDGVAAGLYVRTDWNAAPPKPRWRRRVGPAWSSVAVVGDRLYTQEQRGESEVVLCLNAATGHEVWAHKDAVRFFENVSGAGPRATPTFAGGRVYALGATGTLNCLDAATGERKWFRDIAADSGAKAPLWGFCSSPLVSKGVVMVFAGGDGDKGLLAYDAESGEPAWSVAAGQTSYTSPQSAKLGEEELVLFFGDRGLTAIDPGSGAVLWEYPVVAPGAPRSIQPHPVGPSGVLISSETDLGTVLLDVTRDGRDWHAERRWGSRALKPSFNDYVIHEGHAYGFDGPSFSCIDLEKGKASWRGGRYGHGQVLLLADQGLLLVTAESGEAVLVAADPGRLRELGRFQAVEGKTWNHPAVARGRLYVRNAEEMACYDLAPLAAP
jgi:outer membrane protein assembly factor BamB